MFDQLIIGSKRSYDHYEANVKERKIIDGKKKVIREAVPFSNVVHDFSKIDGEFYWENKTLQYTFEITASTPEELGEKLVQFKLWVMNVMEEELHDPYTNDYHFVATFSDISVDDTEWEKATITVTFTAYPYMIANVPKMFTYQLTAGEEKTVSFSNVSSHPVTPTFDASVPFNIKVDTTTYAVPSGETTDDDFQLGEGLVELKLTATENGTVTITFHEEVF